jgi:hypothetical protein
MLPAPQAPQGVTSNANPAPAPAAMPPKPTPAPMAMPSKNLDAEANSKGWPGWGDVGNIPKPQLPWQNPTLGYPNVFNANKHVVAGR